MLESLINKLPPRYNIKKPIIYKKLNEFPGVENQPVNISLNAEKVIKTTNLVPKNFNQILNLVKRKLL